jgi:hypothetical protein
VSLAAARWRTGRSGRQRRACRRCLGLGSASQRCGGLVICRAGRMQRLPGGRRASSSPRWVDRSHTGEPSWRRKARESSGARRRIGRQRGRAKLTSQVLSLYSVAVWSLSCVTCGGVSLTLRCSSLSCTSVVQSHTCISTACSFTQYNLSSMLQFFPHMRCFFTATLEQRIFALMVYRNCSFDTGEVWLRRGQKIPPAPSTPANIA